MKLLLPFLLLSTWPALSQTTNPAITSLTAPTLSSKVCLESHQAEVIQAALTRFELLMQDSLLLVSHGHLLTWYQATYLQEQQLHQETTRKLRVSQQRATRRGLLAASEAVLLGLIAYSFFTK
jgi:hypothetical protein